MWFWSCEQEENASWRLLLRTVGKCGFLDISAVLWVHFGTAYPTLVRGRTTGLGLLCFRAPLDEPSLELLGLDAVLAATTFAGADAALGGPHVFRSFLKHHHGQDCETGTPGSAAWNAPPTDYLETLKHAGQHNSSACERAETGGRGHGFVVSQLGRCYCFCRVPTTARFLRRHPPSRIGNIAVYESEAKS